MGGNKSILIIDNDRNLTSLIKKFLQEVCGYEVTIVPDGYNGIITAKKIKPGIILLDIRMPAMNGLEILERLKNDKETSSIPVIIMTGFDDDEIKRKAVALNIFDYLVKPVGLDVLRDRIAAALTAK